MSATVIDSYGTELGQVQPPAYSPLKTNQSGGRVRVQYFTKVFAAQAAGEDVALCTLPKGARIIGGKIIASATLANSATLSVGLMGKDGSGYIDAAKTVSDAVAALLAAVALGATMVDLAATQALKYGYETEKELYVTCTTAVGTVATETVSGHISYVVD